MMVATPLPFCLAFSGGRCVVRAPLRKRTSQLGLVTADPVIVPCLVIFHFVAVRVVDSGQLLDDLFTVRACPALNFVGADVELPPGASPIDPAVGPGMLERKARLGHVVGVTDVDHRIAVRLVLGIGFVHDGEDSRTAGRGPTAEDSRSLEGVTSKRSEADHVPTCTVIWVSSPS